MKYEELQKLYPYGTYYRLEITKKDMTTTVCNFTRDGIVGRVTDWFDSALGIDRVLVEIGEAVHWCPLDWLRPTESWEGELLDEERAKLKRDANLREVFGG